MDLPAVSLLLLEQRDRFLKDHTRNFLDLAFLIHFPNSPLCVFLQHQPKKACKGTPAHGRSPREFCLICGVGAGNCGWPFTIRLVEECNASPRQCREPSQPSAMPTMEQKPEPTIDTEPEPAMK